MWCVPALDDEYLTRMRRVLELYEQPLNPRLPVVCLDEKSIELHEDKYPTKTTSSGLRLKDHEYVRRGTANIFVMTEPKGGRHYARVTRQRRRADFAKTLRFLAQRYPKAITIFLVMDNLNTHDEKSLIQTFGEQDGRELWARFTPIYTPKHASWLNQAELMISVMSRCAIGKERVGSIDQLRARVGPFFAQRRRERWTIDWRFSASDANRWVREFMSKH